MKNEKISIFLVDDDALFLKLLEVEFLASGDFVIETFPSGETCVTALSRNPDVIILDYHLDGIQKDAMNGLDTLDMIKAFNPDIPVIMLSSQDRIDVAVNCMHHRALDYVVKSETSFLRLQKIISNLFTYRKMEKTLNWYVNNL